MLKLAFDHSPPCANIVNILNLLDSIICVSLPILRF